GLGVLAGARGYMLRSYRLLWGDNSRNTLNAQNVERPERIVSFGSPFHEVRYGFGGQSPAGARPNPRAYVLVTFGVRGGYVAEGSFRRAAAAVLAAAKQFADQKFVIKPHPGDPGRVWRQMVADSRLSNVEIVTDRDTYDLMRDCGVLFTMFS